MMWAIKKNYSSYSNRHTKDISFHTLFKFQMCPVCRPAFNTTPDCSNSADTGRETVQSYRHWQNRTKSHHKSTARLQPSWTGSCLERRFGREGPHLPSTISIYDPLDFFSARLCKRWGLSSVSAYNVEQRDRSNRNSDLKTVRPLW
jgi:hypothetical protein